MQAIYYIVLSGIAFFAIAFWFFYLLGQFFNLVGRLARRPQ